VTAGGKNVAPAVLEDRLRAHPLVDQCMVVGDGRPFIAALITLDPESVTAWAEHRGKPTALAGLLDDADLRAELDEAVEEANKAVSQAEAIRRYAVLAVAWTEEGGELTPSLKLKRDFVMRAHRGDVADLYGV
jgi:long-chain acyl-CoA synthetase